MHTVWTLLLELLLLVRTRRPATDSLMLMAWMRKESCGHCDGMRDAPCDGWSAFRLLGWTALDRILA